MCPFCDNSLEKLARYIVETRKLIINYHRITHIPLIPKGDEIRWNHCKYSPCVEFKEMLDGHKALDFKAVR